MNKAILLEKQAIYYQIILIKKNIYLVLHSCHVHWILQGIEQNKVREVLYDGATKKSMKKGNYIVLFICCILTTTYIIYTSFLSGHYKYDKALLYYDSPGVQEKIIIKLKGLSIPYDMWNRQTRIITVRWEKYSI